MDLGKELDKVYSRYIRLRDAYPNGMIRCISCGRVLPFDQFDCGHYFSRYHLSTRWDEHNCNAECIRCNRFDPNHLVGYKRNLIAKIGQKAYDELERKHNEIGEMPSAEEFKELIAGYRKINRILGEKKDI